MKNLKILVFVLIAILISGFVAETYDANTAWKKVYPKIQKQIKEPVFKNKTYSIADYGAVADNPDFLNDKIINSTIDLCSNNGGGTVLIPKGVWHTGPVVLKSKVNLQIEEGATLLFTPDITKYPTVLTRWEGMDCYNTSPMIYSYGQENIAITGKGTIDGGASRENWWGMMRLAAVPGKEMRGRPLLMDWNEKGTPVEQRIMGPGDNLQASADQSV